MRITEKNLPLVLAIITFIMSPLMGFVERYYYQHGGSAPFIMVYLNGIACSFFGWWFFKNFVGKI